MRIPRMRARHHVPIVAATVDTCFGIVHVATTSVVAPTRITFPGSQLMMDAHGLFAKTAKSQVGVAGTVLLDGSVNRKYSLLFKIASRDGAHVNDDFGITVQ